MGHKSATVFPSAMQRPTLPWSVLEYLKFKDIYDGDSTLSTATSARDT